MPPVGATGGAVVGPGPGVEIFGFPLASGGSGATAAPGPAGGVTGLDLGCWATASAEIQTIKLLTRSDVAQRSVIGELLCKGGPDHNSAPQRRPKIPAGSSLSDFAGGAPLMAGEAAGRRAP